MKDVAGDLVEKATEVLHEAKEKASEILHKDKDKDKSEDPPAPAP